MDISNLHVTQSSVGLNSNLDRLAQNINRSVLDPKKYEGFTVKVGKESSPDGILGGVLSQKDYDKFMDIVKDVNVMNASYDDMAGVWRSLVDANLLPDTDRGMFVFSFITGSKEYDEKGRGINTAEKYNQMEYQRASLPFYADKLHNNTRSSAIDGFKIVAAIANASPKTGEVIAKHAFASQERSPMADIQSDARPDRPLVQLSSLGQLLAKDESKLALTPEAKKKDDENEEDSGDDLSRLAALLESAKIQRNLDKQDKQAEKLDGKPE